MSIVLAVTALVAVSAVVDWEAVARGRRSVDLVAKPLTLALLIAVASAADLGTSKPWVVLALALGLIGDVALLFSAEEATPDRLDPAFLVGLGAFLLGHLAYYGAFRTTRHHRGVNRRMLQVASWDDTTYRWLGIEFQIDAALPAAQQLFHAVRDAHRDLAQDDS